MDTKWGNFKEKQNWGSLREHSCIWLRRLHLRSWRENPLPELGQKESKIRHIGVIKNKEEEEGRSYLCLHWSRSPSSFSDKDCTERVRESEREEEDEMVAFGASWWEKMRLLAGKSRTGQLIYKKRSRLVFCQYPECSFESIWMDYFYFILIL